MKSPTKRTNRKRAGLVLLSVTVLVGTGTVAWGHGSASSSIPDPADGRIHACFPNNNPRTLRVVAPTQTCPGSQSGVDWPANGVLTQLSETAPVPLTLAAGVPNSVVISCAPKQAINVLYSGAPGAVFFMGSTRGGTPAGTEITASLYSGAAQTVPVRALCVTSFEQ